ncbi:putative Ubiquitin carboxyl-terminal hydrolase 24 [Blattamonas nauphoetae]|uniref:ubiquitinyl hydrolase 1 n=1 Tax=Blattamonas nauphoetae TaxID=2049346 RepID=A0ABQ9XQH8_9EUKA|nr:putative Ubiquitin carboxyl-terminal hydrolase 24 [Blattamonas nauphoetae]
MPPKPQNAPKKQSVRPEDQNSVSLATISHSLFSKSRQFLSPPLIQNIKQHSYQNPSNLCFANSTIQLLFSCPPFVKLLCSLRQENFPSYDKFPHTKAWITLLDYLNPIIPPQRTEKFPIPDVDSPINPNQLKGGILVPTPIYPIITLFRNLRNPPTTPILQNPRPGPQEDAAEFLSFCLNGLEEELRLQTPKKQNSTPKTKSDDEGWSVALSGGSKRKNRTKTAAQVSVQSEYDSLISMLFAGEVASLVEKKEGIEVDDGNGSRFEISDGTTSQVTVQRFLELHVDIGTGIDDVESGLDALWSKSSIDTTAESFSTIPLSQTLSLHALPPVLILHLKRFKVRQSFSNPSHFEFAKEQAFVSFPPVLSLSSRSGLSSSYSTGRQPHYAEASYTLFAVVEHVGATLEGGHYTTFVRRALVPQPSGPRDSVWVHCDDSKVRFVQTDEVLQRKAYILLYVMTSLPRSK